MVQDRGLRPFDWTPPPLFAAALASLACGGLVLAAWLLTGHLTGRFLIWNLLLAWLPMLFALLAARPGNRRRSRWGWGILWLLFFPNAPYICTDLVHVGPRHEPEFWPELGIVLLFSLTGLVVGYLSLHRMQSLITRHFGAAMGWVVVLACSVLGAAGVAIGRFLRWNSWDALVHPLRVLRGIAGWALGLPGDRNTLVFLAVFTVFLALGYLMFHSMGRRASGAEEPGQTSCPG